MGRHLANDPHDAYALGKYGALIDEALALLGEGISAALIEEACHAIGMGAGALAILDQVSLARADEVVHSAPGHGHGHGHGHAHAHDHDHDHGHTHGRKPEPAARVLTKEAVYVVEKMSHGFKRMGRDAGGGFYDYPPGEAPTLWPGLKQFERGSRKLPARDIEDRLRFAQILTNERIGNSTEPHSSLGDVDSLIARMGQAGLVARCRELSSVYGNRFALPSPSQEPETHHQDSGA